MFSKKSVGLRHSVTSTQE